MIIDCHGHYTTAPKQLDDYRRLQVANCECGKPGHLFPQPVISDDDLRASVEGAQLRLQRERGTDMTIFSPRAVGMGHHIGDEQTSMAWSTVCNDLIYRVVDMFPKNFV